ncbi:DUF4410 domain-containing protein [Paraburkholderia kururiensis]|uniref:DUF4410 domain-containing protein n=1 Tax=Paraburkholderia kururiensis TaxID=984307 RepID=UPI0018F6CCAD|nr:DUF4410 domain-containing protein [Paraburkholderia kururiensis]
MSFSSGWAVRRARRWASATLVAACLAFGGCASGISGVQAYAAPAPVRPDVIYVYPFDDATATVQFDNSLSRQLKASFSGTSAVQQQYNEALAVRGQVASELVRQLRAKGLDAVLAPVPPSTLSTPSGKSVLVIEGSLDTLDAGRRSHRMLIGFGAGKSEVEASVQLLYQPRGGVLSPLQRFDATADSGKAPGVVAMGGVGAAAGSLATSVATSGGLHAVSEAKHDTFEAEAKRLADSIAKQVVAAVGVKGKNANAAPVVQGAQAQPVAQAD